MRAALLLLLLTGCFYQPMSLSDDGGVAGDAVTGDPGLTGDPDTTGDPEAGDARLGDPASGDSTLIHGDRTPCLMPVRITAPQVGTVAQNGVNLVGTCSTGASLSFSGDIEGTTGICDGTQFSVPVTFTPGDGDKIVTVSQPDPGVCASSTDSRKFVRQVCMGSGLTGTDPADGDGTAADPWVLCTAEQLDAFADQSTHWTEHTRLGADIPLSTAGVVSISRIGSLTNPFYGEFDGDGHSISGIKILQSGPEMALFRRLGNGSSIHDLTLIAPEISSMSSGGNVGALAAVVEGATIRAVQVLDATVNGEGSIGGLVGHLVSGSIEDCSWSGVVHGTSAVGGLVGTMDTGSIGTSYSTGTVDSDGESVGGIVGKLVGGTVSDSYSLAAIATDTTEAGGIIGTMSGGNVVRCHHTVGLVSAVTGLPAGIAGSGPGGSAVAFCYFTGTYDSSWGGEMLTSSEMNDEGSFSTWDFSLIWLMDSTSGYPTLRWQL